MEAPDEAVAERLAEEFIGGVKDNSTPEQRTENKFRIVGIETVNNDAFDAILVEER